MTERDVRGSGLMGRMSRPLERLFRPTDIAWLAAFRVLFGALLAFSVQRFMANGWVDELLLAPRFRFKYWGFAWVEPLPSSALHTAFWVLFALGLCVAAGFMFRVAALFFALGFTYIQLLDVTTYLNHYYLAVLLSWLLAVSPAGRAWSIDAWLTQRWRRSGEVSGATGSQLRVPVAWHYLFRIQVGLVYTFAGLAKAQSDWLLHGQPLRIWLGANTKLPILGRLFTLEEVPLLMSWCGFLFDITIVWWLLYRRTRAYAYVVVIVFHLLTQLLFNIGMFPSIMMCSALVFFSASWPRNAWAMLRGQTPAPRLQAPLESGLRVTRWQQLGAALGLGYCCLQALLPLRHLAYGGNVLWHEQGMRFSWRVMVRVKGGGTTFQVRNAESGRVWHVSPREYLTPRQEAEMSSQPDLILQLAHHIQKDYEARGLGPVQVHAESSVTLNGRRSTALIDPQVDLTTVRDGVTLARWVLPAPAHPPPHTRPVL